MTAAAIKRGGAKPRRVSVRKREPSRLAAMLRQAAAAVPISGRTVERAITWGIVGIVVAGAMTVAQMLDVPHRVAVASGEALGRAGLSVKHIDIRGIERMDRLDVYAVALDQQSIAMPLVDLDAVRAKLLRYGWVADARVSRRLPDTLVIDIVEREPAAVWQHARELTLVDAQGVVLAPVKLDAMPDLPLLIGPDANTQSTALTALMAHAPRLKPVLDGAVWVGGRRWNLKFQSGETLMLPDGDRAAGALRKFAELDAERRLLGQGVQRFDMRLPEQMAVLPGAKRALVPAPSSAGDKPKTKPGAKPLDPSLTT